MAKTGGESVKNRPRPAQTGFNSRRTESEDDEFGPLSGKPYFHVVLSKSHLKPYYNFLLPVKILLMLPSANIPTILNHCGKSWKVKYSGANKRKGFDRSWSKFAEDNNLNVGDACVFEVMECTKTLLRFRVQILRGDFPPELLAKIRGETSDTPITIE